MNEFEDDELFADLPEVDVEDEPVAELEAKKSNRGSAYRSFENFDDRDESKVLKAMAFCSYFRNFDLQNMPMQSVSMFCYIAYQQIKGYPCDVEGFRKTIGLKKSPMYEYMQELGEIPAALMEAENISSVKKLIPENLIEFYSDPKWPGKHFLRLSKKGIEIIEEISRMTMFT